jgi:hypothetical protein
MTHQGWDLQLIAYAARDWRANFFPVGIAHSVVGGSAWEPTPWRAVQRAAMALAAQSVRRSRISYRLERWTRSRASAVAGLSRVRSAA